MSAHLIADPAIEKGITKDAIKTSTCVAEAFADFLEIVIPSATLVAHARISRPFSSTMHVSQV